MAENKEDKIKVRDNPADGLSIVDSIRIFIKYKKIIIFGSILVGLITAIAVFFVIDPIFLSLSSVKAASKPTGLSGFLPGGLSDIGDLNDLGGGSSTKELALYENILNSRRCVEETIIKFNLLEDWDIKYMQDAVRHFRLNVMEIKKDKQAGIMEVGVYGKDPQRAMEINDFLISELNKINTELNIQSAKNNRIFIEERYNLVKEDLKISEDSLKHFQDIYGISPDIQIRAAAQSEIQITLEIKSEEIKLELLKKILSPNQAEVKEQEDKISALQRQLYEIQNSTDKSSKLNLKGTPDIVLNYYRLSRNVEIQNKILTFILPLFEQAKIEENKETPTVIILDAPNVPERKVKPKRLTSVAVSLLGSFVILFSICILYETLYLNLKRKISFRNV